MSSGISWRQVLGEAHTGFYDVFIILTLVGNAVKGRMSRGSIDPDSDLLDLLKVEAEANLNVSPDSCHRPRPTNCISHCRFRVDFT